MRIAVYGAGGVGGCFGDRLAQAGSDVHFIDRGAHLQVLREHSLRVQYCRPDASRGTQREAPHGIGKGP